MKQKRFVSEFADRIELTKVMVEIESALIKKYLALVKEICNFLEAF